MKLRGNKLGIWPPVLFTLTALTTLSIAASELERIPHDISVLTGLKQLDVSCNRLHVRDFACDLPCVAVQVTLTCVVCSVQALVVIKMAPHGGVVLPRCTTAYA